MFDGFIGQDGIKNILSDYVKVSGRLRIPHLLMIASAGLGKTKLARMFANELGKKIVESYGPTLDWDCAKRILTSGVGVWYIDEIHGLNKELQDKLLGVMLDFKYVDGDNVVNVAPFVMLGSTTDPDLLAKPFMDRFHVLCFNDYSIEECVSLATKHVNKDIIDSVCLEKIACVCDRNPRKIINMINDMHVYHLAHDVDYWNVNVFKMFMNYKGLDEKGLGALQRKYLDVLGDKCMSLQLVSSIMGVKPSVVSLIVEPDLVAKGLIEIKSKGRMRV